MNVDEEPLIIVRDVLCAINQDRYDKSDLMLLTKAFVEDVRRNLDQFYLDKAVALVKEMMTDRERVIEKRILSKEQLDKHHFTTFSLSMELLLGAIKSEIEVSNITELIDALGWCSVVRDLRQDLSVGIINIPCDVIEKTGYVNDQTSINELIMHSQVSDWLINERLGALATLDTFDGKLLTLKNKRGYWIIKIFSDSIKSVIEKRFFKLYPHLRGT